MLNTANENTSGRLQGVATIPDDLALLIDANQAARIASTSAKFIRDRCKDGTIKAVKIGRVWRINRDEFLKQFGLSGA